MVTEPLSATSGDQEKPDSGSPAPAPGDNSAEGGQESAKRGRPKRKRARSGGKTLHVLLNALPVWLGSMLLHLLILLVLAMVYLDVTDDEVLQMVIAKPSDEQLEELGPLEEIIEMLDMETPTELITETVVAPVEVAIPVDEPMPEVLMPDADLALSEMEPTSLIEMAGGLSNNLLSARGEARGIVGRQRGASEESEAAVAAALRWLAEHQFDGGSWSFNHAVCPECHGRCSNHSTEYSDARIAATGLALLPFLGAGETHYQGIHKRTVSDGIYYLRNQMVLTPQGGSLWESGGQMYGHGIASIALCEAYAMTRDDGLKNAAQQSLNFIVSAQDPNNGGWRYKVRQGGDTSVVGWQLMALKSGHLAYLHVPPSVIGGASRFLDSMQVDGGSRYGYDRAPASLDETTSRFSATTAIGLLCRMYLGWEQDRPALRRGVQWLSELGPSPTNVYFNYYATQVMSHAGGPPWEKWNSVMRDQLVATQSGSGHETGSWSMVAQGGGGGGLNHSAKGGRLYDTAMATMVLEVYYRHLPIYGRQSTQNDFPLE